jgi:hypothetical protein
MGALAALVDMSFAKNCRCDWNRRSVKCQNTFIANRLRLVGGSNPGSFPVPRNRAAQASARSLVSGIHSQHTAARTKAIAVKDNAAGKPRV